MSSGGKEKSKRRGRSEGGKRKVREEEKPILEKKTVTFLGGSVRKSF